MHPDKAGYKPPAFWRKVRESWISGEYATISALSKAWGVSRNTIKKHRDLDHWDEERARIRLESRKRTEENLINKLSEVNLRHMNLWSAFDQQVATWLRDPTKNKTKMKLDLLESIGRVLEKSQKGIRLAIGADKDDKLPEDAMVIVYPGLEEMLKHAKFDQRAQHHQDEGANPSTAQDPPSPPPHTPAEPPPAPVPPQPPVDPPKRRSGVMRLGAR